MLYSDAHEVSPDPTVLQLTAKAGLVQEANYPSPGKYDNYFNAIRSDATLNLALLCPINWFPSQKIIWRRRLSIKRAGEMGEVRRQSSNVTGTTRSNSGGRYYPKGDGFVPRSKTIASRGNRTPGSPTLLDGNGEFYH
ncbi:uncharacterized protein CCOS01_06498 [Colletotrichum costaricense]|uniref:Uncharacterized protein n=1 Tax=Colletotrichum costaricense TaxID=1209916 RepID=A0AAI9YYI5_9PEZI|nr:uncharacterized protein CCOS01_06498 [Colletotrichum costaricense]KAK1528664.1 hypothetical protein CCOS01_06498 [Colletotrichum costaricense]